MSENRYLLFRRNNAGIHEPIGRFTSATEAREHADQDAQMRRVVDRPYVWGVSYQGTWVSEHPDITEPVLGEQRLNDYIVIDSAWNEVDPATVVELPPYDPSS